MCKKRVEAVADITAEGGSAEDVEKKLSVAEFSEKCTGYWRKLTAEEKQPFEDRATELKAE